MRCAELGKRDRRRAAFAAPPGGRGIRGTRGGFERRLHRQQYRHHGSDGVAGAGHVANLDRIGGDMDRRMTIEVERHALLAAGHQHGFAFDQARQFGRGLGDFASVAIRRSTAAPSSWRLGVIMSRRG